MDNETIYIYGKALSMDKKRHSIYECLWSIDDEGLYVFKRPSSNGGASRFVGLERIDGRLSPTSGEWEGVVRRMLALLPGAIALGCGC